MNKLKLIYNVSDDLYIPGAEIKPKTIEKLPPVNFIVKFHMLYGYHLQVMPEFDLPEKFYGDVEYKAQRIIQTFQDREGSTGVLLEGEKGSGKTMLAKLICKIANRLDMPVIMVSDGFTGTDFNRFIQNIDQPKIVLFDEFEKTFLGVKDTEGDFTFGAQDNLLTLLDGTMTTKTLYIFTCNEVSLISDKMLNRPGRIFYHVSYDGLDEEFILGYCQDNLKNKDYLDEFKSLTILYDAFNFDMLKALVEESNRYDENPKKFLSIINARPNSFNVGFDCTFFNSKNKEIKLYPNYMSLNVSALEGIYNFSDIEPEKHTRIKDAKPEHIFEINAENTTVKGTSIITVNSHGNKAVFTRTRQKKRFAFTENM